MLWMDFPRRDSEPLTDPTLAASLAEALGVAEVSDLARTPSDDLFATLPDEASVRALQPDFGKLAALPNHRGLMVSALADAATPADLVSRFFVPNVGINEDPVTGSAHCVLAPFWGQRLGKTELAGYQCSARGGTVLCRIDGDRVHLGGRAVTIYSGEIGLPSA
jgi:predicted PhzF superfamily epimerase YddE/YHI9